MSIFEARKLRKENLELLNENISRREEIIHLFKLSLDTERKLYNVFQGKEFKETIVKELELTPLQEAKLDFIFSIEAARLAGVSEDKILHNKEEMDAFFNS